MSNRSDAERILYAVIDGEIGFESVADVRAFIQNEWQASDLDAWLDSNGWKKGQEAAEPPVVEAGPTLSERITAVVEGAPTISARTFAALALPLLMEADNEMERLKTLLGVASSFIPAARYQDFIDRCALLTSTSTRSARVPDPDSSGLEAATAAVEEEGVPHASCMVCGYDKPLQVWRAGTNAGVCADCYERARQETSGVGDHLRGESHAGTRQPDSLNGPSGTPNPTPEPVTSARLTEAESFAATAVGGVVERMRWEDVTPTSTSTRPASPDSDLSSPVPLVEEAGEPFYADPYTRIAWWQARLAEAESERDSWKDAAHNAGTVIHALKTNRAEAESLIATLTAERNDALRAVRELRSIGGPWLAAALRERLDAAEAQADSYRQALERIAEGRWNPHLQAREALAAGRERSKSV